jgi:hypothetical protein
MACADEARQRGRPKRVCISFRGDALRKYNVPKSHSASRALRPISLAARHSTDCPEPASFNLEAVKEKVQAMIEHHQGQ